MKTFKEKLEESVYSNDWYELISDSENGLKPLGLETILNNDQYAHDSYGNENSKLERIFFDAELNQYIKFYGTRQSYNGEEWDGYAIVEPKEKTVSYFEEIK